MQFSIADIISKDAYLNELNEQWYEIAPNLLQYNFSIPASEKNQSSSTIKQFYFSNNQISRETEDILIQVNQLLEKKINKTVIVVAQISLQMLGDRLFYNDITSSLKLHTAAVKPASVYCYNFIYKGKFSPYTYHFTGNSDRNYGSLP